MTTSAAENLAPNDILSYVTQIVSAYLSRNEMPEEMIADIVRAVYRSVLEISKDVSNVKNRPTLTPAVPIEESVHDDYIICLEDGKKLQMLKRHLNTVYNMTVEQYRERWQLPLNYPMVSPNYAQKRSQIAKTTGLGSTGRKKSTNRRVASA